MATNPKINIPASATTKCSIQCMFWYDYKDSLTTSISNNTTTVNLTYDGTGSTIMYNSIMYSLATTNPISIYAGGIHTFEENSGLGPSLELVVNHYNSETNTNLYVCIPISSSGTAPTTNALTEIITHYFPGTTSHPSTTNYPVNQFNLNYIIPKTTYFIHKGMYHNSSDNSTTIYVVFPYNSLNLSSATITSATTGTGSLSTHTFTRPSTLPTILQNTQGTTVNGFSGNGQIYIDCQPTDSQGEIVVKEQIVPSEFYKFNMSGLIYFIVIVVSCMVMISLYQKIKDFFTINS